MLAELAALLDLPFLILTALLTALITGLWMGGEWLMNWFTRRREARMTHTRSELDHTQDELRRTILQLADALGVEAHEARKALIRESYLATGRTPDRH
jgi:hypothetical protein